MKQYNQIKSKYPGALLLFRVGDFYETFGEDAIKTSKILGIVLTKRKNGAAAEMELAGFPHHSLETYLPKLVRAGQRVAVCDQLEDPKLTKTIVKRGVTELVSPGVAFNDQVLQQKNNNFLCAIHFGKAEIGIAFMDVSTGEFLIGQGTKNYIDKLISSFQPSEFIYQKQYNSAFKELNYSTAFSYRLDDWVFNEEFAKESLSNHFGTKNLNGFGVSSQPNGIIAAAAALHYVKENQLYQLTHLRSLSRIQDNEHVWMDRFTIQNLELLSSSNENATTLLDIIDHTNTPMGGRLLKRWLVLPLTDLETISSRHSVVSWLVKNKEDLFQIRELLNRVGDLERLISKAAVGKVNPREINHIHKTLSSIPQFKEILLRGKKVSGIDKLLPHFETCDPLLSYLSLALEDSPALAIGKGNVIRTGFDHELDDLRSISQNGKSYLEKLQIKEAERTGISSLKISYNNVFGYYIEVRNTHKDKVPETWVRRQTLVNAERYVTEELKVYEEKIITAESKILQLEQQFYQKIIEQVMDFIEPIQKNSYVLARLDVLCSFANVAISNNYVQPEINESFSLHLENARHPVIEKQLQPGEHFVPNDVFLDNDSQQIIMVTGPNMSGKSALLRQTALIVIMAQMGAFVPADKAEIGLIDKIFTRVGATDNISSGESTFMVEMNETASILNNLSPRSLVILDEIGRGTSTYDGISIAWAISEYLHENKIAHCKTLFATHYHELNEMSNHFDRIKNYSISVKEIGKNILFLRKLVAGGSEHSFGIHVAKIAGMPPWIISRAEEVLQDLEKSHHHMGENSKRKTHKTTQKEDQMQLSFFQLNDPVLEQIHEKLVKMDINSLTPVEALMKLNEIKKLIGG